MGSRRPSPCSAVIGAAPWPAWCSRSNGSRSSGHGRAFEDYVRVVHDDVVKGLALLLVLAWATRRCPAGSRQPAAPGRPGLPGPFVVLLAGHRRARQRPARPRRRSCGTSGSSASPSSSSTCFVAGCRLPARLAPSWPPARSPPGAGCDILRQGGRTRRRAAGGPERPRVLPARGAAARPGPAGDGEAALGLGPRRTRRAVRPRRDAVARCHRGAGDHDRLRRVACGRCVPRIVVALALVALTGLGVAVAVVPERVGRACPTRATSPTRTSTTGSGCG